METDFPPFFQEPGKAITEIRRTANGPNCSGSFLDLFFEGVLVWHGHMQSGKDLLVNYEVDFPVVQVLFSLTSNTLYCSDSMDVPFSLNTNQFNICYMPWYNGTIEWKASEKMESVEFYILPEYFDRFLPEEKLFQQFRTDIQQQRFSRLSNHNLPITAPMQVLLRDIVHSKRKNHYRRLEVEAKLTELLLLQFEQFRQFNENPVCATLKQSEIEKMYFAREIILSNYDKPCSLIDLAHEVGTNEYKLKKHFKAVFGNTVFGYLNNSKMAHAKDLLQSGAMNVTEVADLVGYKNTTHFTAAFKKHFGILPSDLKL
ncbi:helix-turn-helix transcriptional regulator [Pseudoflavitalea sp. G-6-1-2]|uniref:helix-turn-helix transcriptional regulator n=1 Tax=Pseudoflavitalea sp. G-6-1-2 TaxID=2728841 RepID=UPI00146C30DA|nr:AraC family transcriptional regulator [Pseudoflavitalea sp. G-6-1-2]NML19411.1 helix-turn-helix transcriptional regulator [Pseudoflavitalea sp. G-6-1-2]